jgi:hypothetical protein
MLKDIFAIAVLGAVCGYAVWRELQLLAVVALFGLVGLLYKDRVRRAIDIVMGKMVMENSKTPSQVALRGVAGVMLGGLAVIVLSSMSADKLSASLGIASLGLCIAGASALTGGLLGFLFGIPRALQIGETTPNQSLNAGQNTSNPNGHNVGYRANTNLEQISDWLTKILVGVGLTQLIVLPQKLKELGLFLAPGFDTVPHPNLLAIVIVMYFSVSGFLFGYLWTRLFLAGALRDADVAALGEKISELERQMSQDAKALSLVQQHLNLGSDSPKSSEDELKKAIIAASPEAKTTIFYQTSDVRSNNWRDEERKPKMERTIPIFRALIESDSRNEYHQNRGQLGFALKDKRNPEWAQAEKELTRAIDIRGGWQTEGWLFYEFNRAICRIVLEDQNRNGKPSVSPNREKILADLRVVASNDELVEKLMQAQVVCDWMDRNQIDFDTLRGQGRATQPN